MLSPPNARTSRHDPVWRRGARRSNGDGHDYPGAWAEQALCAQADPDAWFPTKGQHAIAKTATRICRQCPVRVQCLDYALSGADTWGGYATGIWGGTTPHERDRLRQQRKAVAA